MKPFLFEHPLRETAVRMCRIKQPVLLVLAIACVSGEVETEKRLVLSEHDAVPTSEFQSAEEWGPTRVVVWSQTRPAVRIIQGSAETKLSLPAAPVAVDGSCDTAKILDVEGREYRLTAPYRIQAAQRWKLPGAVYDALPSSSGWIVATRDSLGSAVRLFRLGGKQSIPVTVLNLSRGRAWLAAATDSSVLLLQDRQPFELITVHLRRGEIGRRSLLSDRRLQAALQQKVFKFANWRALRPVVVGSYLLVTLTNMNGDERVVAVLSSDGALHRLTRLRAPFGIVGGGTHYVIGGRVTDRFELVRFSWRWAKGLIPEEH